MGQTPRPDTQCWLFPAGSFMVSFMVWATSNCRQLESKWNVAHDTFNRAAAPPVFLVYLPLLSQVLDRICCSCLPDSQGSRTPENFRNFFLNDKILIIKNGCELSLSNLRTKKEVYLLHSTINHGTDVWGKVCVIPKMKYLYLLITK